MSTILRADIGRTTELVATFSIDNSDIEHEVDGMHIYSSNLIGLVKEGTRHMKIYSDAPWDDRYPVAETDIGTDLDDYSIVITALGDMLIAIQ